MTESILKIPDVSEHNGDMNIQAMKDEGAPAIMIRLGYQTATGVQEDAQFRANRQKAQAAGFTAIILYVFAYPGRSGGVTLANGVAAVVGELAPNEGLNVDMESEPVYGRNLIDTDPQFCADAEGRMKSLLGPIPTTYMNSSTKHRFEWAPVISLSSGLHEAAWYANNGEVSGDFPAADPWPNQCMWQYTSRGSLGGKSPLDLSAFAGTIESLQKYMRGGSQPTAQPPAVPASGAQQPAGNGTSYAVNVEVAGYVNAANAAARVGSNSRVPVGVYFVYNQSGGMVNISRTQGVPGWWINPADNGAASAPNPVEAPSGHWNIAREIDGFYTAADAANHNSARTKVEPGDYFVFNTSQGMVNVTKVYGAPGSWINPADNSGGGTNSNNSDAGSTFNLGHATAGYTTAGNAANGSNSNSNVQPGLYAVFNRAQGMVNITRSAGVPGWWINPNA